MKEGIFIIYTLSLFVLILYIWAKCQKASNVYTKEIKELIDDDNLFI
jgi:hypothetical protein